MQGAFTTEHTGGIYCVSWSPDGSQVLTSSGDKTCKIWDVETGKSVTYDLPNLSFPPRYGPIFSHITPCFFFFFFFSLD